MAATNPVTFGVADEIRRLRLNAGFKNQKEFAAAMGVSRSTVSYWETGEREPTISQYRLIIKLAGHSIPIMRHLSLVDLPDEQLEIPYPPPRPVVLSSADG